MHSKNLSWPADIFKIGLQYRGTSDDLVKFQRELLS